MPSLRVDMVVALIVTILTILLIKSTSLLPASLYFQFSRSFSSDLGVFLIPKPMLEARQHCEVAKAKGYTFRDCPIEMVDTDVFTAEKRTELIQYVIETQNEFTKDDRLKIPLEFSGTDFESVVQEIDSQLSYRDTIADLANRRLHDIAGKVSDDFMGRVRSKIESNDQQGENGDEADYIEAPADGARTSVAARFAVAEVALVASGDGVLALPQDVFRIRALDAQLRGVSTVWEAIEIIKADLDNAIVDRLREEYERQLAKAGVNIPQIESDAEREIAYQAAPQYILALLIRLAVPLVAGLIAVVALGSGVRVSVALGCGLAAFLLAWPVVLLWDGVVEAPYRNLRYVFFGFYIAYCSSFATMGYLGATLGEIIRSRISLNAISRTDDFVQLQGVNAFVKELPWQVSINFFTNGITLMISYVFFGSDIGYSAQ